MKNTFLLALLLSVLFSVNAIGQNQNKYLNLNPGSDSNPKLISDLKPNKEFSYSLKKGFYVKTPEDDSSQVSNGKNKVQKLSMGGLFLAPNIGISYPLGTFASNSGVGFVWGAKLEFAFSKLYPFVPGLIIESQDYKGAAGFISNNLLTDFSTEVLYYGGSIDIILNKFLRSDFTTPVFSGEVKFATITRTITPDVSIEDIQANESLLTFSTGLAFTLYVVDLGIKYTYADVYSNLNLQMKVHFPLFKF